MRLLCVASAAALLFGCSGSSSTGASDAGGGDSATGLDGGSSDGASADATATRDASPDGAAPDASSDGAAPRRVSGLVFDGPLDAGPPPSGASYTLDPVGDAGAVDAGAIDSGTGVTIGSPCATGVDCAALGPLAGCFHNAAGGFCTLDCDTDPEGPSVICPAGTYCFAGLSDHRLCLQACTIGGVCSTAPDMQCSGALATFNTLPDPDQHTAHVCLPSCATDADCNTDTSGFICDPTAHRCEDPADVLGSACTTDADCLGLGPGGACLKSERDPSSSYCTRSCNPAAACSGPNGEFGACVSGYATTADGADVPVCLRHCGADSACQTSSVNTCNYVPSLGVSLCTVACTSDADCIDGTCDSASGDCRQTGFYSPRCGSGSNCPGGLCVQDFHHADLHNCSARCASDSDCPMAYLCVTSPDSQDSNGVRLGSRATDPGFCAPSCTLDAGTCPDTTSCLTPTDSPDIDFAGSGSASGPFCWI